MSEKMFKVYDGKVIKTPAGFYLKLNGWSTRIKLSGYSDDFLNEVVRGPQDEK